MRAVLQKHQTLIDIALQYCGNADAMFELALLNGVELTAEVLPGTALLLPDVLDAKNVKLLADGDYRPTTGPLLLPEAGQGLEFWAIELDFIIS